MQTRLNLPLASNRLPHLPVLQLLHPRQETGFVLWSLAAAILAALAAVQIVGLPLWAGTLISLAVLFPAGIRKWRDDYRRYGLTVAIVSALIAVQGLHSVEHIIQWMQYHLLYWTMRQSNGLVSPANAEWVHFLWNWAVMIVVTVLMLRGLRNWWMWLLAVVAGFHAIEHTYTFVRYVLVLGELQALKVTDLTAQGLPGILGRDGWLARCGATVGTPIRAIPGLTTAIRLDVHFWWNTAEIVLILLAAHVYLKGMPSFAERER